MPKQYIYDNPEYWQMPLTDLVKSALMGEGYDYYAVPALYTIAMVAASRITYEIKKTVVKIDDRPCYEQLLRMLHLCPSMLPWKKRVTEYVNNGGW